MCFVFNGHEYMERLWFMLDLFFKRHSTHEAVVLIITQHWTQKQGCLKFFLKTNVSFVQIKRNTSSMIYWCTCKCFFWAAHQKLLSMFCETNMDCLFWKYALLCSAFDFDAFLKQLLIAQCIFCYMCCIRVVTALKNLSFFSDLLVCFPCLMPV